jgi:hypothetical protein
MSTLTVQPGLPTPARELVAAMDAGAALALPAELIGSAAQLLLESLRELDGLPTEAADLGEPEPA